MGKRSDFERRPRDFYPTPREAVWPLLPHLEERQAFVEPCAGDGALVDHLALLGHECLNASDIEPRRDDIGRSDAREELWAMGSAGVFITNPPWERKMLHAIIMNLSGQSPTWLLMDADWVHTLQAVPFLPRLRKIVSVGRVKWIPDSPFTGKDNCAWHLFDKPSTEPAVFIGRVAA